MAPLSSSVRGMQDRGLAKRNMNYGVRWDNIPAGDDEPAPVPQAPVEQAACEEVQWPSRWPGLYPPYS